MEHKSNGNIVYSCKHHVVFCPKCRRLVLVGGVDEHFRQTVVGRYIENRKNA